MPVVGRNQKQKDAMRNKARYGVLAKVEPWRCPECGIKNALPRVGQVCISCDMEERKHRKGVGDSKIA